MTRSVLTSSFLCLGPLAACLLGGCRGEAAPPPPSADFYLGGIQIREPNMEAWLDTLRASGFNTLSVTVYARQGRWDSAELASEAEGDWIIPEIRAAKARGLHVVLILRVALEHALADNLFLWHGMILARDEDTQAAWFARYGEFVNRWARIAEAERVDLLGIGSELNALVSTVPVDQLPVLEEYYLNAEKQTAEHDKLLAFADRVDPAQLKAGWGKTYDSLPLYLGEQTAAHRRWAEQVTFGGDLTAMNERRRALDRAWRRLIAEVRAVYSGQLTYAANFDQYQMVSFWDALDLIGINAYFPLRRQLASAANRSTLPSAFTSSWRRILGEIDAFRGARGLVEHAVVFTELGYTFRADSTLQPWAGGGFGVVGATSSAEDPELVVFDRQPIDYEERALAVRALRTVTRADYPGLLKGVLYWKLSTQPEQRAIEPFVLIIGEGDGARDPLAAELRALVN